jgi:hypothetical protein
VLKASLLTFPMIVSILILSPQFVYAQDAHGTLETLVTVSDAQGTDQQEADEGDIDQDDNAANLQEVEIQKKPPLSHKKHNLIASTNGDAIQDMGNDDLGN